MEEISYLGETIIDVSESIFKDNTKEDWIQYFIESYGQIDGDHHKAWLLDQIMKILNDCKIIIKLAQWSNGQEEYRISIEKHSDKYETWISNYTRGCIYSYETGIAP